jgi:rare lipoprotein A
MKKLVLLVCIAVAYFATPAHALPPEIGIANYYGDQFHGSKTASDEIYDKELLTAAHKTLPYGTIVRVTLLATGASVDVRINDRGPFVKGRVIILSRKAAETLNIFKEDAPQVKLEVVQKSDAPAKPAAVVSDKPVIDDKPATNNPAAEKALADKAAAEKALADKAADKAAAEKALADKKAADKTAAEKALADKKAADKTAAEKALADKKAADKTAADKAITDKATTDKKDLATNKTKSATVKPTEKSTATKRPSAEPALNFVKEAGKMSQGHLYKMQVLQMEEVGFGVQIAAYSDYESVFNQLSILQENHYKGGLVYVDELNGKNYYKVILGPFFTREEAVSYCNSLRKKNEMKDAFVVDLDKLNAKAQAVSIAPGNAVTPATAPKTSAKVVTPATKKTGK